MSDHPHPLALHQARALAEGLDALCADPAFQAMAPFLRPLSRQAQNLVALLSDAEPPAAEEEDLGAMDQAVLDGLLALAGPEMAPLLLNQIRIDLAEAGTGLTEALPRADWEQVRRHSHVLVSVAGSIGAVALQHRAEAVNSAAHAAEHASAQDLCTGIAAAILQINARLAALCLPAPPTQPQDGA